MMGVAAFALLFAISGPVAGIAIGGLTGIGFWIAFGGGAQAREDGPDP